MQCFFNWALHFKDFIAGIWSLEFGGFGHFFGVSFILRYREWLLECISLHFPIPSRKGDLSVTDLGEKIQIVILVSLEMALVLHLSYQLQTSVVPSALSLSLIEGD
ncbi:hypothetical protein ACET3Z_010636 [Daucus carota]